jgi:cell wall-associated NlpC family hydrolase
MAWDEPRRRLIEPAQVQDPPALASEARPAGIGPDPAAQRPAGNREPVLMARADDAGERANNEDIIREALRNRGKPYIWGGASRGGFDCSGFICYVFRTQRGMKLPHSASAQARLGKAVKRDEMQPGDLVFFSTYRRGISHVGIYLGDGKFIHAANRRKDTRIDSLDTGYWARRLKAARRLTPAPVRVTPQDVDGYEEEASVPPPPAEQ